jgi:hypothetical protein
VSVLMYERLGAFQDGIGVNRLGHFSTSSGRYV